MYIHDCCSVCTQQFWSVAFGVCMVVYSSCGGDIEWRSRSRPLGTKQLSITVGPCGSTGESVPTCATTWASFRPRAQWHIQVGSSEHSKTREQLQMIQVWEEENWLTEK
jgi:hypothetical protein